MYPFLILSSLSVGFYLVLLVALHRDSQASPPAHHGDTSDSVTGGTRP